MSLDAALAALQRQRGAEWAAPELLEFAETALPLLRKELTILLESHCTVSAAGVPDRKSLEPSVAGDVGDLEAAISIGDEALAAAAVGAAFLAAEKVTPHG